MSAYTARMGSYLAEMFPPGRHLAIAAATYLAMATFMRTAHHMDSSVWSPYLLLGIWSYFAVPLMLRLMDELKDADIDRALFADRPLPSGRVTERDIRRSLAAVMLLYLGSNLFMPTTLLAAGAITLYAVLMFKRFFAERVLRASLPITLLTHNPIVPLSLAYGVFLFAAEHAVPLGALAWRAISIALLMLWAPFLAWEFSRKIRAPGQENAYVTYTQLLGLRGAVAAVLITQGVGVAAALWLTELLPASPLLVLIPALAWLVSAWAGWRFLRRPNATTSRLRPFAELFLIATLAGVLMAFWAKLL